MMKDCKELPLYYRGLVHKFALVDREDYLKASQVRWLIGSAGLPFRLYKRGGKYRKILLSRQIMRAPKGVRILCINGNPLDCRRENLHIDNIGCIFYLARLKRAPYQLSIKIEGELHYLGCWPSRRTAEEAGKIATQVAINLRGRGIPKERVRRVLDLAIGREVARRTA